MTRALSQHDASAGNRAYYERAEIRLGYRPDGGLDAAESALVEHFLPAAAACSISAAATAGWRSRWPRGDYPVEGLDISPSMIEEARAAAEAAGLDARFRVGDAV